MISLWLDSLLKRLPCGIKQSTDGTSAKIPRRNLYDFRLDKVQQRFTVGMLQKRANAKLARPTVELKRSKMPKVCYSMKA